jgi:hypothetical protein
MAKKSKVEIEINAKGGPSLKKSTQEINKQKKALDKLDKSEKRREQKKSAQYTRQKQGVIQTANQTKNFSKLQQSVDGGGAGGLVRAYALLAANVFALSAAFGVLSRSAQVDTLSDAMKQLEIVSGNSVRAVARDLQVASGMGLDMADAMRSTSLALSAGFDASAITELGEVARNAAVSLGRPMGDALDRIFRGVIKVEPELLDEIGLFVRVKEAAAKYASDLGIAASELTEFQKRQAFANEAIQQGKNKFEAFKDIKTDPYSQLAAAFSDVAQSFTSVLNSVVGPLLETLAGSKQLMTGLFVGISVALLSKAIPALGLFARTQSETAERNARNHQKYIEHLDTEGQKSRRRSIEEHQYAQQAIQDNIKKIESEHPKGKKLGGAKRHQADLDFKAATKIGDVEGKLNATLHKRGAILTTLNNPRLKKETIDHANKELANADKIIAQLKIEKQLEKDILELQRQQKAAGVQPGTEAFIKKEKLAGADFRSSQVLSVVGTAETKGLKAGWDKLRESSKGYSKAIVEAGGRTTMFGKVAMNTKGIVGLLGVTFGKVMRIMQGWMMAFALLVPLITWVASRLGVWDKQSKIVNETIEKTTKLVDLLSEKIEHNSDILNDNANFGTTKWAEANLAMHRTIRDTTKAIIEQRKELKKWFSQASDTALWWEEKQAGWGFGMEASSEKQANDAMVGWIENFDNLDTVYQAVFLSQEEFVKGQKWLIAAQAKLAVSEKALLVVEKEREALKAKKAKLPIIFYNYNQMRKINNALEEVDEKIEMHKENQAKAQKDVGFWAEITRASLVDQEGLEKKLNVLATRRAAGMENLLSIATGAKDVARDFSDALIKSTEADKPLAVFEQIMGNINSDNKEMLVTDVERENFIKSILKKENAIADIMSVESFLQLEQTALIKDKEKSLEAGLKIIEDERNRWRDIQLLLIKQANILKYIAGLQKHINTVTKKTSELSRMGLEMETAKLKIAVRAAEVTFQNQLNNGNISNTLFEMLEYSKSLGQSEEKQREIIEDMGLIWKDVLTVQNAKILQDQAELNLRIHIATIESKHLLTVAKIMKERITSQEKLNKAIDTNLKLQAQLERFKGTGSTKLNVIQQAKLMIAAEERRLELAEAKAKIEKAVIVAQYAIIKATLLALQPEIELHNAKVKASGKGEIIDMAGAITGVDAAVKNMTDTIDLEMKNSAMKFAVALRDLLGGVWKTTNKTAIKGLEENPLYKMVQGFKGADIIKKENQPEVDKLEKRKTDLNAIIAGDKEGNFYQSIAELEIVQNRLDELNTDTAAASFNALRTSVDMMVQSLMQLGPEGVVAATIAEFGMGMQETLKTITEENGDAAMDIEDKLLIASQAISGLGAIMASSSAARVAGIDNEIAAEKKRDGKSKESVAKIRALEVKKDKQQRKAFEQNKKIQMATTIINTATTAMKMFAEYGYPGLIGALAMGATQLAIIASTSYQSGLGAESAGVPAEISVGERSNKVDITKGASMGELAYLRGERGIGTTATNFTPQGGASGLRKGYANGGEILVGEQGPEVITPLSPMQVWPSSQAAKSQINANFTIHAIDAQGVEEVLLGQQGNIINMIRNAANDYGEEFLEDINTDTYGEATGGGG